MLTCQHTPECHMKQRHYQVLYFYWKCYIFIILCEKQSIQVLPDILNVLQYIKAPLLLFIKPKQKPNAVNKAAYLY